MHQHQTDQTHQLSFAQIGTLYNSISNELEGGVTQQNQSLLLNQVANVQSQMQGLINSGALNQLDGASIVHAQNVADQLNFLKTEISAFGTNAFVPKFINDVVRDIQDVVAGDSALNSLAHQGNNSGFQQVSFLLTAPTPFPDTPLQTDTLLKFVADSNSLADRAVKLEGADPHSADVQTLISDIKAFSTAADAYSTSQGGLFSARFNNEFTLNGVQGTASRELITGLQTGNTNLIDGAASVLVANASDVRGNMLANGQTFTPLQNGGIPVAINTVHDAGVVFNDAMTKLIGGVYSGNQQSIVNDLHATQTGLQNAIAPQGLGGQALQDINHVIALLGQEASMVSGINTASPTQVSSVNGQINQVQAQILSIIGHDTTLAPLTAGADGTTGFASLPQGTTTTHQHPNGNGNIASAPTSLDQSVAANVDYGAAGAHGHSAIDIASAAHHLAHLWG
jgi:hypothetical protein